VPVLLIRTGDKALKKYSRNFLKKKVRKGKRTAEHYHQKTKKIMGIDPMTYRSRLIG
jgi:hypothetical protein